MDRRKFDTVCEELQVPKNLADHIWKYHPPPDEVTDEELHTVIAAHALAHAMAAMELNNVPGKPDGLAA